MILERLSVAGFRTFAEPVEFIPDARFTVIHAPNGTGKSTLLEALYFGLLERHSISGDGAKQRFKSLGRDITPAIEIDFTIENCRYRLRKTFLSSSKSATLRRWEGDRYIAFRDGGAADDFVRELFSAVPPGKGVLEPNKHLGFHHVLFSPARASFSELPESVGDQIRSMLGGSALAVTDGERAVEALAAKRFSYFFRADGALKTAAGSANVPLSEEQLRRAREAEITARQEYGRLERLAVDDADREAEAQRMNAVRNAFRIEIDATKIEVEAFNGLGAANERAIRAQAEARYPYERIRAVIEELADLRAECGTLLTARDHGRNELEQGVAAAVNMAERHATARRACEDAGAVLADVQRRAAPVTAAEIYVHSSALVERLGSTLALHDEAAANVTRIQQEQATAGAPSRAELEVLREATAEADALKRTIAASALSLEIAATSALSIEVIVGDNTGPLLVTPGCTATIAAAEASVVIDIPGIGRIRARGTDGALEARTKLRPIAAALHAANERFGTISIPELAGRTERAQELQRALRQAQKAMHDALGTQSLAGVRASLAEATARIVVIVAEHPAWQAQPPNAPALRAVFDHDFQAATDAVRSAALELLAIESPKEQLEARISRLRSDDAQRSVKLDAVKKRLATLENDGRDDALRTEHEQTLALQWGAARAQLANVEAALARFIEDPRLALERLSSAERAAGEAYETALGDAKSCRTQLDIQATLGSYAKLVAAEELVAQWESDVAAAHEQASAIACLSGAFEQVRRERIATVVEPITVASTRFLTRIVGAPIGRINIGRGLVPEGLIETNSGLKLPINGTLSTGEQEQIYLATRLALAEVIATERGRQLFVIDDALTATDPSRLRRFIGILEQLSHQRLQIIVTTADRSRYLGLTGAKHFDLAAVLLSQSAA